MMATILKTSFMMLGSLGGTSWFGLPVVLSCQVVLIAAAGLLMTDRISGRYDESAHRIWLTAITLAVALAPVHLLIGGWPIRVATPSSEMRVAPSAFAAPNMNADANTATVVQSTDQRLAGEPSLVVASCAFFMRCSMTTVSRSGSALTNRSPPSVPSSGTGTPDLLFLTAVPSTSCKLTFVLCGVLVALDSCSIRCRILDTE